MLAYYFPPLGGAGVQRTVKFLKHLPSLGYEAVVVTGPKAGTVDWAPPDPTLAAEVPASTSVIRIASPPPTATPETARRRRLVGRPSVLEEWWRREALDAARPAMRNVDVVYASMSPFGSAKVAAMLAAEAGVPWVADLRDPWALDDWAVYPSALHRWLERRRMRSALCEADATIMNTEEARRALVAAFPELGGGRIAVIPNGWDRDDFTAPPEPRTDGAFRIVYMGYSHVRTVKRHRRARVLRRLLGGAAPGVDHLARSHVPLIRALDLVREQSPDVAARVEVHVAGAAPFGSDDAAVVHHGYLPHREALGLLRSADLIFLPMHDLMPGVRAATVMGKTYEYLASGRPVLAGLPDSDVRDLLEPLPNVRVCRPNDAECMADSIRAVAASAPSSGTASADVLERFERRALAVELVRVFDSVLDAGS